MNRILIVGTGALANLFGSRLTAAGFEVTLLGNWKEGVAALKEHGIRVVEGERVISYPVKAVSDPSLLDPFRLALVLVKSWQTPRAGKQLAEGLVPEGIALSLQNGLGNRETLARILGRERTAQGVTTTGATLLGPARVRPGGEGEISIGMHPRIMPLVEMLQQAGFAVKVVDDVDSLIWRKLLINVGINPLTAILGVTNGQLVESASALTLMARAVEEVLGAAAAEGVDLGMSDPLGDVKRVAVNTAQNTSSMLQDVRRGAPTEIDAICGGVCRAAEKHGKAAPVNRALMLLVKSIVELKGALNEDC